MAHALCELTWIRNLMNEMGIGVKDSMTMYCNNQVAIRMCSNPIFHKRIKHIEIDCHFTRNTIMKGDVCNQVKRAFRRYIH